MNIFFAIQRLFHLTETDGFSVTELQAAPQPLPQLLVDYYQQMGKIKPLNHTQDQLLAPREIYLCEQEKYLVFYEENQCCCVWGIQVEDLTADDPPVYISHDQQSWIKDANTLSEFLWTTANFQAVLGGLPFSSEEFISIDEQDYQFIKEKYAPRPQNRIYFAQTEFFANHDDEVIMISKDNNNTYICFYASAIEEYFQQLEELFSSFL